MLNVRRTRVPAVVDQVEAFVPALTRDATVTVEPGDDAYLCKLNGHDPLGLKGPLTVSGG